MIRASMVAFLLVRVAEHGSESKRRALIPARRQNLPASRAGIFMFANDSVVVFDLDGRYLLASTPEAHYGLSTMRERARCLGGELTFVSGAARTQVWVRLAALSAV